MDRADRSWLDLYPPMRLGLHTPFDVAEGGFAHVYLCDREVDPPRAAVKRLKPPSHDAGEAAERFVAECHLWIQLGSHPNIVQALSAHGAPPEPPMVVLEYVPSSVAAELADGPLPLARALPIAADICAGMAYVRSVVPGLVHADLKPANVLLTEDGRAKVSDFGLARARSGSEDAAADGARIAGSPPYMAPEQCRGEALTVAADVYAFGCTLHEMLTGRPIFRRASIGELLRAHQEAVPDLFPGASEAGVPPALVDLVARCVAKEPGDRPADLEAVRGVIDAVAREVDVELPPEGVGAPGGRDRVAALQGLIRLGLFEEARTGLAAYLAQATGKDRDLALLLFAECCTRAGDLAAARRALDEADELIDEPVLRGSLCNEMARLAGAEGNPELQLRHLEAAIAASPGASILWHNLAVFRFERQEFDESFAAAQHALSIASDLRLFNLYIWSAILTGRYAQAQKGADRVVEMHRHLPDARLLRVRAVTMFVRLGLLTVDEVRPTVELDLEAAADGGTPPATVGELWAELGQAAEAAQDR